MAIARALDPIAKRQSRGPESTRSKLTHVHKSELSEIDLPLTYRHVEALGASDPHRDSIVVDCEPDLHREASEGSPVNTWMRGSSSRFDCGLHRDARMVMMHREVDALRGGIAAHLDASIFIGRSQSIAILAIT